MGLALTKYGWPEVVIFPAIVLGAMIACLVVGVLYLSALVIISIETVLAVVLIWVLSFFRDPYRRCPLDKNLLLSPADGEVTNIEIVKENDFTSERAIRIGIFLSIFDVHINRAPCNVKVERISYKKGRYKNAANPESGQVNESNDLCIIRTDSPEDRLIVRQISGAIARRIVCAAKEGQELAGGEKFGMIKFGSRTELYVPARANVKCLVQIGDGVKAGLTPLVRYE
ncbi:MAG: phosphatidylserine decarboxylase [Sedimentisphaerales bacterium]